MKCELFAPSLLTVFRWTVVVVLLTGECQLAVASPSPRKRPAPTPLSALAYPRLKPGDLDAPVFSGSRAGAPQLGLVRRGSRLRVRSAVTGTGCRRGHWYALRTGGFVCTSEGFRVRRQHRALPYRQPGPMLGKPLPYRYAKSLRSRAPVMRRLPPRGGYRRLVRAIAGMATWPSYVRRRMSGAHFVAITADISRHKQQYLRLVDGHFVRRRDVRAVARSGLIGARLGNGHRLPLAFVVAPKTPALLRRDGTWVVDGFARRYHRFTVRQELKHRQASWLMDRRQRLVARSAVRVARRISRPKGVPVGARWVHFDLNQQVFVAYLGQKPVYASLISSGLKKFRTPPGLYRIRAKHVSVTMRGPDPKHGHYHIEEVPWTQFYHHHYAIHGAYWHDQFGRTRSHGCTNLAPADARWLFRWTTPKLPKGWHARLGAKGTWVYFTR